MLSQNTETTKRNESQFQNYFDDMFITNNSLVFSGCVIKILSLFHCSFFLIEMLDAFFSKKYVTPIDTTTAAIPKKMSLGVVA